MKLLEVAVLTGAEIDSLNSTLGMSKDSFHDNGNFQLHECPNGLCSSFCKQIDLIQILMYNLFLIKIVERLLI